MIFYWLISISNTISTKFVFVSRETFIIPAKYSALVEMLLDFIHILSTKNRTASLHAVLLLIICLEILSTTETFRTSLFGVPP